MRIVRLLLVCALTVPVVSAGSARADAAPGEQTTTVQWGPFTVPGGTEEDPGMIENAIVREGGCQFLNFCVDLPVEKPCDDCFITKIVPNMVDADTGETINFADEGMLHHAVNLNWSSPDVTCPPGSGGAINFLGMAEGGNDRFFATGNERTLFEAPRGYGLPVDADDEWGLILDLMNMMPDPRDVALEYTFTWVPSGAKPLTAVWLDVNNCGSSTFDVPMGYSDTHWDWQSTISGRIKTLAGHLHDGGISLATENVTRNRRICTSRAGYERGSMHAPIGPGTSSGGLHPKKWWQMTKSDHPDANLADYDGHIAGATDCRPNSELRVGDTVRLHAQYNMGDMGHGHGVMGITVAYVDES